MHIASGCAMLAAIMYKNRHNKIATYIHWCVLKDIGINTNKKWYELKPIPSIDVTGFTILWDLPIITDHTVPHNRPDMIVHNRNKKNA